MAYLIAKLERVHSQRSMNVFNKSCFFFLHFVVFYLHFVVKVTQVGSRWSRLAHCSDCWSTILFTLFLGCAAVQKIPIHEHVTGLQYYVLEH